MRNAILALALLAAVAGVWGQPIASDSCGVAVELREKYGPVVCDTGTVVTLWNNFFVVTKRDRPPALYPVGNYAVQKLTKLDGGVR